MVRVSSIATASALGVALVLAGRGVLGVAGRTDPMMDAMEDALLALDVSPSRIHAERFGWV